MEEDKSESEVEARPCLGILRSFRFLKLWAVPAVLFLLLLVFAISGGFFSRVDDFNFRNPSLFSAGETEPSFEESPEILLRVNCTSGTEPRKCPSNYPKSLDPSLKIPGSCPEYFRWIYEDLRPWKETGITREMLERPKAREFAHFRFVVIDGKAYLETFKRAFQTRDVFTIWGLLQLLRLYPGKVPDLELMFCCEDITVIPKSDYPANKTVGPPPLFHYCGKTSSFDIPFPDWSFWGWPEVNIRPWEMTLKGIREKSKKMKWEDRQGLAYWKGNILNENRRELMKCNKRWIRDWKVRAFSQNWDEEIQKGFKTSNLEDQCKYRYKIYVEGRAWSVSEKYIMACNSTTLMVKPDYYDFFTRGMYPLEHYWPIRPNNKCRDIKFAVDWGNKHPSQAQKIGETGTKYLEESVKIDKVYEYMLHMLTEYAKLLRFKPEVPSGAIEICSETMACQAEGQVKMYMLESMVIAPSGSLPCTLPPPFDSVELDAINRRKANATRQVKSLMAGKKTTIK